MELCNLTENELLEIVTDAIPSSLGLTTAEIKAKIKRAISYINSFYVDNDLGVYLNSELITFYNSAIALTNVRTDTDVETRWQIVGNIDIKPIKLLSCMLKEMTPADIALPADISFIQDINITIEKPQDINTLIPEANKGAIGLLGGVGFHTVLSLDTDNNTFADVATINAILTYARQATIPSWSELGGDSVKIDVLFKDINWLINLVLSYCNPSHIDGRIKREIRIHENNLLY